MWIPKALKKFLGMSGGDESVETRLCRIAEGLDEEFEEKNGVLSRRNFLISIPAILAVRKVLPSEPLVELVQPTVAPVALSGIIIQPYADFLAPGAIEITRYQTEIFNQVQRKFVFGSKWKPWQREEIHRVAKMLSPSRLPE